MEYFAKSSTYMQLEKRKQLANRIRQFIDAGRDILEDKEIALFQDYAEKIEENQKTEHKQLQEHLEETLTCAENFFSIYGEYFSEKERTLVLLACAKHDIGKANRIFQAKVNDDLKKIHAQEIPHGFLSALILSEKEFLSEHNDYTKDDFRVLLTSIYYHHTRLDSFDSETIKEYYKQYYQDYVAEYENVDKDNDSVKLHIFNKNKLLFSTNKREKRKSITEDIWCKYMIVKGLLNKFDWTVSAGYMCAELCTDKIDKKLCKHIESAISEKLRPSQQFMKQHRDNNVIVIAPTGSGKTEASLLWLNGEKGFYTLPLKVSSNAIYKRVKERYKYEDVALLHSDSMNSFITASDNDLEQGYSQYEQAKLFAYPLTICTVDQLFLFVYKALGTEIFAATLKYSKIVIDEIQSYSPRVVAALLFGLSEIKRMGGKFAIVTATFPPILQYFMEKYQLLSSEDYVYKDFSDTANIIRHKIKIVEDDFNIDEIIENGKGKKVLVICNTVSMAQEVYKEIQQQCQNVWLLHSRFIRMHREILEEKIMHFCDDKQAVGIWVTTQIVEASLDIDFDLLYTQMCTADSLLQRMGRCNRVGNKEIKNPNIIIYNNESARCKSIYDKDIYEHSLLLLKQYDNMPFSETDKIAYINAVYDVKRIKASKYFEEIRENIEYFKDMQPLEHSIEEARKEFRAIHSITVIPESIYKKYKDLIDCIHDFLKNGNLGGKVRKILKNKLAELTISVNLYYKIPDGIDREPTFLDVHRAKLDYKFDEEKGVGLGLSLNKIEQEDYFV